MWPTNYSALAVVAMSLWCNGCATFAPKLTYQDLVSERPVTAKQAHRDLEIAIEEFVSSEKSRQVFDADIASYGVLAFFLRIKNQSSTSTYRVQESESKAFLGQQTLVLMQGIDAAGQSATRGAAGNAAAWTVATGPLALLFWPVAISASGAHTGYVNEKIGRHFDNLQLGTVLVQPSQTMGGFLYFKIPNEVKKLEGLVVEVVASDEKTQDRLTFSLPLPTFELPAAFLSFLDSSTTRYIEPGAY